MQNNKKRNFIIHYLPNFGCISTGIIYGAIGVIAILSFFKLKDGGADESSLMAFLNEFLIGKIVVLIILLGTVSYIIWRIYETITDPYGYGNKLKGLGQRTGIALSTVADFLIVLVAVQSLIGAGNIHENGQPEEQRRMVQSILQKEEGTLYVIGIGIIIAITALVQLIYGVTRGYKERLEVEELNTFMKRVVHFLGITGYFSRGIILGIIAYSYLKAGFMNSGQYVVNTDKAFDFIGDNIGHIPFLLIAAGTICYGMFMFALGVSYDIDKD